MSAVKMSFSFSPEVANALKQRAQEQSKPVSRYLADLVEADTRSAKDALADEGYRLLADDTHRFAEETLPLMGEVLGLPGA